MENMGFQKAIEELRERAEQWEVNALTPGKTSPKGARRDSMKRARELNAAADALETVEDLKWHDITKHKKDLPDFGERVIICVGYAFVGEGYLKDDGKWYRYCDFGPVDEWMTGKVVGWMKMPRPMPKPEPKAGEKSATE